MNSPILRFQQDIFSQEYFIAAALGLITGVETEVKFGHCPLAAAAATDVWELGGTQPLYIFPPDAGEAMELVGLDVDDIGHSVLVSGLDADGLPQTDTKILNGTTPVPLTGTWSSIHRICNLSPEGVLFTGLVIVRTLGGAGEDYAVADTDDQQTSQALYKVPSNKIAVIVHSANAMNKATGSPNAGAINRLKVARKDQNFQSRRYFGVQELGTSNLSAGMPIPLVVGPWARIKAQATPSVANTDISAEFSMLLIDTDLVPDGYTDTL